METLKNRDMVIISNIEWSLQWQRHQIFSTFFAKICRKVIFVESHGKRNPTIKDLPRIFDRAFRFIKNKGQKKQKTEGKAPPENLIVVAPFVLPSTWRIFRRINKRIFIPILVRSIKNQGIMSPMIMNYLPTQTSIDLIEQLEPFLVVYDCVENFPKFPGVPKDTADIEKRIFESADLVITDSTFLFAKASQYREDAKRVLPGVDYDHFAKADTGVYRIPFKSICFFGGINDRRIDFDLLSGIAKLGGFTIDMIGPVDSKIPTFPSNVVFHGPVDYSELPEHLKSCDCFLFPYIISDFTKGIIPAKLFECFATGKPVITTPLPTFFDYEELMYICKSSDEVIETIQNLENLETAQKYEGRKELAKQSSWESRFDLVVDHIKSRSDKITS
jgi:glycosyltransferase involved in cell wall biosynthesis